MKTIKQTTHFNAAPEEVYRAFMDPKEHSEFTEAKAVIFPQINGRFEVYDGYAVGTFLKLVPGELIEATWKEVSEDWPPDHYSQIRLDIIADENGTELKFTQKDVPDNRAGDVAKGWQDYYWVPLKDYFND